MNGEGQRRIRFLPAPPDGMPAPRGRYGPGAHYVSAVWLPILGPSSCTAWQHLARQLHHHPAGVTVTPDRLSADLGLGSPNGQQSALARTMRRLERFGIIRTITDDLVLVREDLPDASPAQLSRLDPVVRARHDRLVERSAAAS